MDVQPREVMVQTQKRFRIITEEEEYKRSLPQDMASYANDNSEIYPRKRCQRGDFDKTIKAREP